jgi:uncharacterized flavoprotein (TIGR03862 family)
MAAETLAQGGVHVDVYDAMPSVGRKFLVAGKGGLNLTHAEPLEDFLSRYGARRPALEGWIRAFGPEALRAWAQGLGVGTFVGTSGRVFPTEMKAAPLLRAWVRRLRELGVVFHVRHRWVGWTAEGDLSFATPAGVVAVRPAATVLALGGGSYARTGSDGAWVPMLGAAGVPVAPLAPANCGFDVRWSEHFATRFAGAPVKSVAIAFTDSAGTMHQRPGEFIITANGIEGSLIYALSAALRDTIAAQDMVTVSLDLAPGKPPVALEKALAQPRGKLSLANHLRKRAGLEGVKAALLRECGSAEAWADPAHLAALIKAVPVTLVAPRPLDEAISSAGGVRFEALDERLMVRSRPGLFCAGEMLDWETPTGGYLLTACFATGKAAGNGVLDWLG